MSSTWLNRLRDWSRRRALRARLDEELAFHLDALTAEHERRGLDPAAARVAAKRELGNVTAVRESHHDQSGLPWIEEWWRDATLAVRNLRRRPGYALSIVGMLAIGLGATMTVFTLTDAVLRRALPVPRADELFLVANEAGRPARFSRNTVDRLVALKPEIGVIGFSGVSGFAVRRGSQPTRSVRGQLVTGGAFAALEIVPAAGRLIGPGDDRIGEPASVAVATQAWAVAEFGSAAAAVEREVMVNRVPVVIVGVLPETFTALETNSSVALFFPAALQPQLRFSGNASSFEGDDRPNDPDWNRENRVEWLTMLARVPTGLPPETMVSALQVAFTPDRDDTLSQMASPIDRQQLERRTWQVLAAPGGFSYFRDAFRSTGTMLVGLVASLLLLTCANVSGIMLVRALSRHREMGVRLALGAGRWRTCRMAVVESLVCGTVGAVVGSLLATWLLPLAVNLLAPGRTVQAHIWGGRETGLMILVAIVCSLLCALAPTWWLGRLQPLQAIAGVLGRAGVPQAIGRGLVGVQLALAVMLVAVALSLGERIADALRRDPGFLRTQVLTTDFDPATAGYGPDDQTALQQRVLQAAQQVAGVERAGLAASGILAGSRMQSMVFPRDPVAALRADHLQHESVGLGYFETVGMTLLQGRLFEVTDAADAPRVVVLSAALAKRLFGDRDPIGQRMGFSDRPDEDDMAVVGVVADARINSVREAAVEVLFTPAVQFDNELGFLAVRVEPGAAAAVRSGLAAALSAVEPGLVFGAWQTLEERMERDVRTERTSSRLAAIVAGAAILLAGFGVGGSLAHLVTLRQRELAVRAALGASPARLRWDVLADGARIGGWGGLGGAVLIAIVVKVGPAMGWVDAAPSWGAAVVAVVVGLGAALAGGWWPARRAAQIDPQRMLKAD